MVGDTSGDQGAGRSDASDDARAGYDTLADVLDADQPDAWLRARGASEDELGPLPFTIVEAAFHRLSDAWGLIPLDSLLQPATASANDPKPTTTATMARLRDEHVTLLGLRRLLLDVATSFQVRDRLLGALVGRAQAERGRSYLAPVGLLLPGLRAVTKRLALLFVASWYGPWWGDYDDLQAELVCGLIEAIATIGPGIEKLAAKLLSRAETHTRRVAYPSRDDHQARAVSWEQLDDPAAAEVSLGVRPRPSGHPDLVLAAAVAAGIISKELAEVISATYLGREPAKQVAARYGMSVSAMRTHRQQAVARLARWLHASPSGTPERHPEPEVGTGSALEAG